MALKAVYNFQDKYTLSWSICLEKSNATYYLKSDLHIQIWTSFDVLLLDAHAQTDIRCTPLHAYLQLSNQSYVILIDVFKYSNVLATSHERNILGLHFSMLAGHLYLYAEQMDRNDIQIRQHHYLLARWK